MGTPEPPAPRAGRRRQQFLASLPIDPDQLPEPVVRPGPQDFIICGCPKSGTTLLAGMLWQPPDVVVCSEPWDGMRLPPAELFASLREEIATTGRLARGRLDIPVLMDEQRVHWKEDEENPTQVVMRADHLLGVKWPAFWRYLDVLPDTRFLVCLRHPYDTVTSFRRAGRTSLMRGNDYDTPFNHAMNADLRKTYRNRAVRQVKLYDYIYTRVLPHLNRPHVLPVRHERWISDPGAQRAEISEFIGLRLAPGPVRLHDTRQQIDPKVRDVVRTHCVTAQALGYALN